MVHFDLTRNARCLHTTQYLLSFTEKTVVKMNLLRIGYVLLIKAVEKLLERI